ncbi:hypothetical protein [Sphingomonas sp. CFBP 8760]|uniref:hypothetical protein n=1 Tax=Sphingomonas sp. CFBP 8760 TaxID=2775282 RepID=UPI00177EC33D|nr:hypothetical protein [Sphingomonas sp. CFBP 8760]MBD8548020.1 hypothetical protein [Sphingomonas sp. CFBP 8760]
MQLNLAKLRKDLAALPGDAVTAAKAQLTMLIDAAERGQAAEVKLAELQKAGIVLVTA